MTILILLIVIVISFCEKRCRRRRCAKCHPCFCQPVQIRTLRTKGGKNKRKSTKNLPPVTNCGFCKYLLLTALLILEFFSTDLQFSRLTQSILRWLILYCVPLYKRQTKLFHGCCDNFSINLLRKWLEDRRIRFSGCITYFSWFLKGWCVGGTECLLADEFLDYFHFLSVDTYLLVDISGVSWCLVSRLRGCNWRDYPEIEPGLDDKADLWSRMKHDLRCLLCKMQIHCKAGELATMRNHLKVSFLFIVSQCCLFVCWFLYLSYCF